VAAAHKETTESAEGVGEGNSRSRDVKHFGEAYPRFSLAKKLSDSEINYNERRRATDKSAVEGSTRAVIKHKSTVLFNVIESLSKYRRTVSAKHGEEGCDYNKILKFCFKLQFVAHQADHDKAPDNTHSDKQAIHIKS
jgi:hypothetical protein